MRKWLVRAGLVVVVLLVLLAGLPTLRLWWALPKTSGVVKVAGVSGPVDILRDEYGIAHIRAGSEADAVFGLGYAHAQDRLWQIEFQRRLGAGRLAEFLGAAAVPTDRLFRTLELRRAAEEAAATISPESTALLEAYARGLNALLASRSSFSLPIEFTVFGITPEPFTVADLLVLPKVMSVTLSTNFRDEALRARIVARVGADGAAALMPAYSDEWPLILPDGLAAAGPARPAAAAATVAPDLAARIARLALTIPSSPFATGGLAASNNWVVAGTRTTTGKPMLANDPHLEARLPSTWYLAHLTGGRLDVIGATLPGLPAVIIGHNARIAWGLTNLMTDVQDLYLERLNAKGEAEFAGRWESLRYVREVIKVKGGADVPLSVAHTRHGPIVTEVLEHTASDALALRWVTLDPGDTTIDAFLGVATAGDWDGFTRALSRYQVPIQNWVYADVDGNIGYLAAGRIPIRAKGDGTVPVPGWTGDHEWTGFVPESQWPRAFNPRAGQVVTANNKVLPDSYPYLVSTNWEPGYRAQRILERLGAAPRLALDDLAAIQADVQSAQVPAVLPWMLKEVGRVDSVLGQAALDRLSKWNGSMDLGSSEAAVYVRWYDRFTTLLWQDELGPGLWHDVQRSPHWIGKALHRFVRTGETFWCDDRRTDARETCGDVLAASLSAAIEDLRVSQEGDDLQRWRWGRDNVVSFPHLPLEAVPAARRLFSRRAEHPGHTFTVSPTMRVEGQTFIASYRQVIDLQDFDRSRFVHPLGQSGQLLSGHYGDLHELWRSVSYVPMRFSQSAVDAAVTRRLRLEP
jgi:penicillin amidase